MTELPINDYISKIILLENRVGASTSYKMLEPFYLISRNINEIQKAARIIGDFVGLKDFTFSVSISTLKKNVGGHIELNNDKNVFIEISQSTADFGPAILATLSHEITHKYLHYYNISIGSGPAYSYENEILTDTAAIYLGLGKLILNGCEQTMSKTEEFTNRTVTTTKSNKSGYLTPIQFSFIYLLVCAMRGINQINYESGLTSGSIAYLENVRRKHGYYFNNRFRQQNIRKTLIDNLKLPLEDVNSKLSIVGNDIRELEDYYISHIRSFVAETNNRLNHIKQHLNSQVIDNELDPCLKYLNAIQLSNNISKLSIELRMLSSKASDVDNEFRPINKFLQKRKLSLDGSNHKYSLNSLLKIFYRKKNNSVV